MGKFTSIAALVLAIALLLFFRMESNRGYSKYPEFDLHGQPAVSSVIYGSAFDPNSKGLQIIEKREDIHIPWTAYLPFYQHATITASRTFDVFLGGYSRKDDSVTVTQEITRLGVLPSFHLRRSAEKELNKAFQKGIDARLEEHRKEIAQRAG